MRRGFSPLSPQWLISRGFKGGADGFVCRARMQAIFRSPSIRIHVRFLSRRRHRVPRRRNLEQFQQILVAHPTPRHNLAALL
jgi:hypothetical protein